VVLRWTGIPMPPEPPLQSGDREMGLGGSFFRALGSLFGVGDDEPANEDLFGEEDE
jgi:hypothetical protein